MYVNRCLSKKTAPVNVFKCYPVLYFAARMSVWMWSRTPTSQHKIILKGKRKKKARGAELFSLAMSHNRQGQQQPIWRKYIALACLPTPSLNNSPVLLGKNGLLSVDVLRSPIIQPRHYSFPWQTSADPPSLPARPCSPLLWQSRNNCCLHRALPPRFSSVTQKLNIFPNSVAAVHR